MLIAIDENDFTTDLYQLVPHQSRKLKEIFKAAVKHNGIVLAGQTEWTANIKAIAAEFEAEQTVGIYKNAWREEESNAEIKFFDRKIKTNQMLAVMAQEIKEAIEQGFNVYAYTTERRQTEILEDIFKQYNPIVFNKYRKHDHRAKRLLRDQILPDDCKIMIGNSAASVGINIKDSKGKTFILGNQIRGKIPMSDIIPVSYTHLTLPTKA